MTEEVARFVVGNDRGMCKAGSLDDDAVGNGSGMCKRRKCSLLDELDVQAQWKSMPMRAWEFVSSYRQTVFSNEAIVTNHHFYFSERQFRIRQLFLVKRESFCPKY